MAHILDSQTHQQGLILLSGWMQWRRDGGGGGGQREVWVAGERCAALDPVLWTGALDRWRPGVIVLMSLLVSIG